MSMVNEEKLLRAKIDHILTDSNARIEETKMKASLVWLAWVLGLGVLWLLISSK